MKVLNPENFSAEQQSLVRHYLTVSGSKGVLVNAYAADRSWDIRPLVLEGGVLMLVRMANPALKQNLEAREQFKRLLSQAALQVGAGFYHGEQDGQIWVRRRFYQQTLSEVLAVQRSLVGPVSVALVKSLLMQLSALHDRGLTHGHVSAANVALDGDQIVLLDHGFLHFEEALYQDVAPDVAPEVRERRAASFESDVYGIGKILQALGFPDSTAEQQRLIATATARQPAVRPTLRALVNAFVANASGANSPLSNIPGARSFEGGARSGRLIRPTAPANEPRASDPPHNSAQGQSDISRQDVVEPPQEPTQSRPTDALRHPPEIEVKRRNATLVVIAAVALALTYVFLSRPLHNPEKDLPVEQYWKSGQISLMKEVASAALQGGKLSQATIVRDALEGHDRPRVRGTILRFVFNPEWESDLSELDREIAFKLSLQKLVDVDAATIPPLDDAHPVLIVAVVGGVGLETIPGAFAKIGVDIAASLKGPVGKIFGALAKAGVQSMDAPVARALSHLVAGDTAPEVITTWFVDRSLPPLQRLRLLLLLLPTVNGLDDALYSYLEAAPSDFQERARWFSADSVAGWDNVAKKTRLFLVADILPDGLVPDQLADLLSFPKLASAPSTLREEVVARLKKSFPEAKKIASTIDFLASAQHQLSRTQVLFLLAALRLEGDSLESLIHAWFETHPDPDSAARLLLVRSDLNNDFLNYELANYLNKVRWRGNLQALKGLIAHSEPLARALAYSQLDPSIADQKQLLKDALTLEPNPQRREDIQRKLAPYIESSEQQPSEEENNSGTAGE